jgi:hypothetical protein
MRLDDFINKLKLALNSKTKYKTGGWGSHDGNLWYFDCVCLIKAVLWGWNADLSKKHGGAVYKSNGVPDIGDAKFYEVCTKKSSNFKTLQTGEIVHMKGHVGVAVISNGKRQVIEATAGWKKNKVVLSDIGLDGTRSLNGKKNGKWTGHGFSPYVNYDAKERTYPGEFPKLPSRGYFYYPGVPKKAIDTGEEVKKLQRFLNWAIGSKLSIDGSYGPACKKAVIKFEREVGTVDNGCFGKKDLAAAKKFEK